MKSNAILLVPLCVAAWSGIAGADEPPPAIQLTQQPAPAARRPVIDLTTAPPAPPVGRTYHYHQGFYLRASVGFGGYHANFTDRNRTNLNFDDSGSSMSMDLLIGGSPSPGVSIGGALLVDPLFGTEGGVSTLIGPFIDGFPRTSGGWHVGGMLGFAGQSFQNVNAHDTQRAAGFGGAAWFGYDFWVADEWAIGPQLRLMGMRTSDTKSDEDVSAFARSFTLGISANFN